jgi:hypothetical protein
VEVFTAIPSSRVVQQFCRTFRNAEEDGTAAQSATNAAVLPE